MKIRKCDCNELHTLTSSYYNARPFHKSLHEMLTLISFVYSIYACCYNCQSNEQAKAPEITIHTYGGENRK